MRKIKLLSIVPDIDTEGIEVSVNDRKVLAQQLDTELGGLVQLETRIVEGGSESIECFYDSALAAPYILKAAAQGERDGFDAIVMDCFLDPALSECRELVRIPVVNMPVVALHDDEAMLAEKTIEAAYKAVKEDGARAVIFGCTGMCTVQQAVAEGLKKRGVDIPVIEPYRAALYDAIACALQGVSHSKYAYWPVEEKLRRLDWKL